MIVLKWLIVLAVFGYISAAAALFFAQRALIYPIPQLGRIAPSGAGFAQAEEHVLSTSDGEKVIVWHVPPGPGQPVVIYFPGNGDTLGGLIARFREITSDGIGLVALSYRGYAGSSGSPSEQGLLIDAAAAYDFAVRRYAPDRIGLWGFSLGSGVAVALAAEHPVGQLILEAPYTSIADIAATLFRFMPVRWLLRDSFHSDERILRVTAPLLIMHGERDSTISIAFGEKLFALAHEPKQFMRFPEGGHNNLDQYGATETAKRFMAALKG